MAGKGTKKEQRKARREAKKHAKEGLPPGYENVHSVGDANVFYDMMFGEFDKTPPLANAMSGILRNMIRTSTQAFTSRFAALPCLLSKNLVWLQLVLVDETKQTHRKLYALGSRVALAADDSDVIERSRKMFKDGVPLFLDNPSLWIYTRSQVRKEYNGSMDDAALQFQEYDPLDNLKKLPQDLSSNIDLAEVFLFFAGDFEVPGDLCSREAVMELLCGLNSKEGINKLHAFHVVGAGAKVAQEKIDELKGEHEIA